jgi:hypothetical protein
MRERFKGLAAELVQLPSQEQELWRGRRRLRKNRQRSQRIPQLEAQLAELAKRIGPRIPARLQELAAAFDPAWLAVVSDPRIDGCGEATGQRWRLRSEFLCEKSWSDLRPTDDHNVRHCDRCKQNVHFCDNITDARDHSQAGHCIAIDVGIERHDGDLAPAASQVMGFINVEDLREIQEEDIDPVSQARLAARKRVS